MTDSQIDAIRMIAAAGPDGLKAGGSNYHGGRVSINGNTAWWLLGHRKGGVRVEPLIEARNHGIARYWRTRGRSIPRADLRYHLTAAGEAALVKELGLPN
jgi:hypothetical protein